MAAQSRGAVRQSAWPLLKADLANVLIIEAVPLAVAEGFDAGVVVAARGTPGMNHDGEELKGQQALRTHTGGNYCPDESRKRLMLLFLHNSPPRQTGREASFATDGMTHWPGTKEKAIKNQVQNDTT